jgi:hypothetical protein
MHGLDEIQQNPNGLFINFNWCTAMAHCIGLPWLSVIELNTPLNCLHSSLKII